MNHLNQLFRESCERYADLGKQYDDLDVDEQQRLCCLYAAGLSTMNVFEPISEKVTDADARQIYLYLSKGEMVKACELLATRVSEYVDNMVRQEWPEVDGIDEEELLDRRNRARDMAAA